MKSRKNAQSRTLRASALVAVAVAGITVSGCTNEDPTKNADVVKGKKLFVQKCGACHVLGRAGTKGVTGPNLDDAFRIARVERWGDKGIAGVVYGQIGYPGRTTLMPANLVKGQDAKDVAAYVAAVAAVPGKDTGLLAAAVPTPGGGKPAVEQNGVLTIEADPNGQLAYTQTTATATAGPVELRMPNKSGVPHNIEIEGASIATNIVKSGTASAKGTLKPGTFTYFCAVPGHRAGGMVGKLTVK
ncbi:unannotated protein [freshwater metagenome]|uniref:Unannotated protein n=1 Tax=freshwater metagenome TaxID=449393 RepID=A0A6J7DZQ1_9ZZZZ